VTAVSPVPSGAATVVASDPYDPRLIGGLADLFRTALRDGSVAAMQVPPRVSVAAAGSADAPGPGGGATCISMPAVSLRHDLYVNKVATIADAGAHGATVTAVVPMFSARDGRYLGSLDGAAVTALKCAAVTALVTDHCAVPDVAILAIIGAGTQALAQFAGVDAVRAPSQIRIYSRTRGRAERFADEVRRRSARRERHPDVRVCDSVEDATTGADVVGTTTTATTPLPLGPLPLHTLVNCMGAHTSDSREVSRELLATSVVFVEDKPTAMAEAGAEHARAYELGDLDNPDLLDLRQRRTVFSSTGCAWLDLLTCAHLRVDIPLWARVPEPDTEV